MIDSIALLVIGTSLAFAVAALLRPPRHLMQVSFALGMAAFALETSVARSLLRAAYPLDHAWWLAVLQSVGLLVPLPWCLFAFLSGRQPTAPIPRAWRLGFITGGAGLVIAAASAAVWPSFSVAYISGPFLLARITLAGQIAVAVELLATVAVLYGFEPSLRNSRGSTRWRLKYLALGLGGIFVVRIYLLSQVLLFGLLVRDSLVIRLVTLGIGQVFVAIGLVRTRALHVDLAVSRHFVYRSVTVAGSGAYLLLAGAAAWVLNTLGLPHATVWGSLVLFLSVMALAAVLLSESLQWRIRRYIGTNFYGEKYDYRQQWRIFTAALTARVTLDSITGQLLRSVTETIGATRAALYLSEEHEGALRLGPTVNAGPLPRTLELRLDDFPRVAGGPEAAPITGLTASQTPALLDAGLVAAVPLPSQRRLLGVVLVGPERTGAPYIQEDFDLLTTLGEQAASAIERAQLSERLAQSRAFDAFSRLTSFVAHDLKNSISALSLLAQNAARHFDDPEFRRDALRTLGRTVERMEQLVGRLSRGHAAAELQFEEVKLDTLAREVTDTSLAGSRTRLAVAVEPVLPVRADADAIQRVLQNLITNGVEAMDGEGTLTIRVYAQGAFAVCSVEDTGCGMSEEFLRKSLFVPFQTTKRGGWGIGLYQAREIISAHGGRIEVSSAEGHGTTVAIYLPAEAR